MCASAGLSVPETLALLEAVAMSSRALNLLVLATVVVLAPASRTAEPDLKADLAALRAGGMATDSKDLLSFFRKRTVSEATRARVAGLIQQLGSDEFSERQKAQADLEEIGAPARPQLRDALADGELEVRRRARRALAKIGSPRDEAPLLVAGARVLAGRKAPGALEVLLDFLPSMEEPDTVDEVVRVLPDLAMGKNDKPDPVLLKALSDKFSVKRWAAGDALARAGGKAHRATVRKLLEDDNAGVRRRVAMSLVGVQDKEAVSALIELLGSSSTVDAQIAEDALVTIAGDKAPASPEVDTPIARQRYQKAWDSWWKDNKESVDLAKVDFTGSSLGLTVVGALPLRRPNTGGVYVLDNSAKELWRVENVSYPIYACMTRRDRVLVCEYQMNRVTEHDSKGNTVWTKQLTTQPMYAQRLANGHTFIAARTQLLVVNRSGTAIKTIARPFGDVMTAHLHKDGAISLLTTNGQCVKLDSSGRQLSSFAVSTMNIIGLKAHFMPKGGVVVPDYARGKVREYDSTGKVVREFDSVRPTSVSKLSNGHYLVCSRLGNTIIEYDRSGRQINTRTVPGGGRALFAERK
jgi:hypothetical protein